MCGLARVGWTLLLSLAWLCTVQAQVPVPALSSPVTDLTQSLDPAAREALQARLLAFQNAHGSQVAVLLVPTTQPETIEQYAIRVVDAWKLGRQGVDDGVLLLVAIDDRTLRIEVGKGLEGAIPDALAKRIIEEGIVPAFRQQQVAAGIEVGIDRVLGLIRGEALPEPPARPAGSSQAGGQSMGSLFVALMIGGMVLRSVLGRLVGAAGAGLVGLLAGGLIFGWAIGLVAMVALFVIVLVVDGNAVGGGGFGGRSGGGGFSSGGGGFSGGGGGFSGGGASGRW